MDIETLHQHFLKSSGVCTDTRNITHNCLFFALKGDNFNGNVFAQEAIDKGAFKVIIDEKVFHKQTGETILCNDVLKTLQELAVFHRKYLNIPIIALTGSNGKTTTKELINVVLTQKFKTTATKGNLNNHIGVPLTILSMNANTEIGIVEMGANHLQEIKSLSEIAQPDFGYITNFGKAHLEGFGSLEGVIKGKTELYQYLKNNNKTVFVNETDSKQIEHTTDTKRVFFGKNDNDDGIVLKDATNHLIIDFKGLTIKSNLIGAYNFNNIAAAIAIGNYFGVSSEKIKEAIENYTPTNNRSQLIEKGTNKIILDAYNANPTSMMAALENFKQAEGDNKILFLGDMFELGADAKNEHEQIVAYLKKYNFGKVYLIGTNFFNTSTTAPNIIKKETFDLLKIELEKTSLKNGFILIKASRGMALERILNIL